MEAISNLHHYRRRPAWSRMRINSSSYLNTARLHLLRNLPENHRLLYRTTRYGALKASDDLPPDIPRVPFTAEELAQIKLRRKHTPDPEDVRYQLQDSKLVQMWNADYDLESQWREYDDAKPAMEYRKEVSGLPDAKFDPDEVVREKRRKVVAVEDIASAKRLVIDDVFMKEKDLEEGEIRGEADCVYEVEEQGHEQMDTESLRSLKEANDKLRAANEAMQVVASGLQDNMLPASPVSEKSESSGNESDDSTKAMCEFELSDNEDYDERSKFAGGEALDNTALEEFLASCIETEGVEITQEEKGESQLDSELG